MQVLGYSAIVVFYSSILGCLLTGRLPVLGRVTSIRWVQTFGKRSYALYLFHVPVLKIIELSPFAIERFPKFFGTDFFGLIVFVTVNLIISYLLAELSGRFLEQPILKLKRHFDYAKTTHEKN